MKAIVITEERMNEVLPQNIKDTDVISINAKKVLATIMNYFLLLEKVKEQGYVFLSNQFLRQSACIKQEYLLNAIRELIEYKLINREVGKVWSEGERHTASKYIVIWNNLTKPLKKKTFEELFSEFLKPSETPMGTTVIDTVTVSDSDIDLEKDIDTVEVLDLEKEEETKQFKVNCYVPVPKVPDVEDLSSYLKRINRI